MKVDAHHGAGAQRVAGDVAARAGRRCCRAAWLAAASSAAAAQRGQRQLAQRTASTSPQSMVRACRKISQATSAKNAQVRGALDPGPPWLAPQPRQHRHCGSCRVRLGGAARRAADRRAGAACSARRVARQPAGHRRIPAQEVEDEEAAHQAPAAPFVQVALPRSACSCAASAWSSRSHSSWLKLSVAHHHVGFEIERQRQRIEVARADRAPLVVHQRHLAVQRAVAVFVDRTPACSRWW